MIVVRDVFHAKYGKGDELVALIKEMRQMRDAPDFAHRILTDASGTFFTVVTETEAESLGAWEQQLKEAFSDPRFGEWFGRMTPLIDSGHRDYYNVVS